jgi:hypothetical protein
VSEIGHLEPLVDISLAPPASVLVNVHFDNTSVVKRFSMTATAGDVKNILSRQLVGQPSRTFDIYYNDVGSPYGHEKMRFLQKTLLAYGFKNDDEIHVQMKHS